MKTHDSEESRRFRAAIGVSQATASKVLACSKVMVVMIEAGRRRLGDQRRARISEAEAAFAVGGLEAVLGLPEFHPVRVRKWKKPIAPEDRDDMLAYREIMGFTQREAGERLGLAAGTIRSIEGGRARITDRIRAHMETDSNQSFRR